MTKAFSSTPLWPYIGVVLCLLVLTILAPRSWQSAVMPPEPTMNDGSPAGKGNLGAKPAPSPVKLAGLDSGPGLSPVSRIPTLEQFVSPRQVAQIAPPVTERIGFDPSVGELPSLPQPITRPEPAPAITPRLSPPPAALERVEALDWDSTVLPPITRTNTAAPRVSTSWPLPSGLMARLEILASIPRYAAWAGQVRDTLHKLHATESLFADEVPQHLAQLEASLRQAGALAEKAEEDQIQALMLRTRYSLQRRVEIWRQVRDCVAGEHTTVSLRVGDDAGILSHVSQVRERTAKTNHGTAWASYLCLDELQKCLETGNTEERRELARRILSRMEAPSLTEAQLGILASAPFSDLAKSLRRWASEPVDYLALIDDLEAYEETRTTRSAHALARHFQDGRWSANPALARLSDTLNAHYRNANVRVAVSAKLINRLLPNIEPSNEDINEYILGAQVWGTNHIRTKLEAYLIPDPVHWRVGLQAQGQVTSETAANAGPATFYNEALSNYLARKLLIVERSGVHVWRAEAEADSNTGLTGLRTNYDRIPILGWIARSIALDQHDSRSFSARREAEERLAQRASERFDDEVHGRLEQAEEDFRHNVLQPLRQLELDPVSLDLHTTASRLIGRYRLAGAHQLAAHTPRPRAPEDSFLSMQIHESALNNTLEQLQLEGKRTELRQLYKDLGKAFNQPDRPLPDEIPEGVIIQFADDEAVRVRCNDDHVALTIRIAELRRGSRNVWTNFSVRARYVPEPTQRRANLVRESTIELTGQRMTSLDRIALSGIFSKALSRSRPFNLINRRLSEHEELHDLAVTQFVISDGWIGVALGPTYGGALRHLANENRYSSGRH